MKKIILLLFILSTLANQVLACSYPNNPTIQAEKVACSDRAGMSWSCQQNMCMTSQQAADALDAYKACAKLETTEAQNQCVQNLAQSETGVSEGEGRDRLEGGDGSTIAGAYAALLYLGTPGVDFPECTSKSIFMGASLGFVAAHYKTQKTAEDKFDALVKDYVDETDEYQKQVKAFEYLKAEQEAVVEIAKERKEYYTFIAAGFGIAAGFATYETFVLTGMASACKGGAGLAVLSNSPAILVTSLVAGGYAYTLRQAAADQQAESEQNIKDIEDILAAFEESMNGQCPGGREDPSEPTCYCHNDDGSRNDNRTNSATCQELWDKIDQGYSAESIADTAAEQVEKGCVTITQKFDPSCQCRKLKDQKTGQNSCLKTIAPGLGFGNIPGISAFSPKMTIQGIDGINSGQAPQAVMTGEAGALLALKTKKGLDKILSTINQSLKKQGKAPINLKKVSSKLLNSTGVRSKMNEAMSATKPRSSTSEHPSLSNAKKSLKSGLNKKLKYSKNKKGKKSRGRKKYGLNFGGSGIEKPNVLDFGAGATDKDYDYKNNDINQSTDKDIFQIISKRYITSGLKALFDD